MSGNNPYVGIIESIFSVTKERYQQKMAECGVVLSVSPLSVSWQGLILDNSDIFCNSNLNKEDNKLSVNDKVLVIPSEDMQTFYICCKVIKL